MALKLIHFLYLPQETEKYTGTIVGYFQQYIDWVKNSVSVFVLICEVAEAYVFHGADLFCCPQTPRPYSAAKSFCMLCKSGGLNIEGANITVTASINVRNLLFGAMLLFFPGANLKNSKQIK